MKFKRCMFLVFFIVTIPLMAGNITPHLENAISTGNAATVRVWIYFTDKGNLSLPDPDIVNERALARRSKVLPADRLIDPLDLPVNESYLDAIRPFVQRIHVRSRWQNAVSATMETTHLHRLLEFAFIRKLDLVRSGVRRPAEAEKTFPESGVALDKITGLDYGPSLAQIAQINVPPVHNRGITGRGVLICMLDNGFRLYKEHTAFDSVDIVGTWDFISNDASVDDPVSAGDGSHGTQTLSVVGGYAPGNLIGPAYGASYLLGRTEDDAGETPVEEDYWVAGVEWAEANGADIVSSSVGYNDWYTWNDMDGETALTTRHADIAVTKGMLVVNSAGNEAFLGTPNTLIAPADGKHVIAVGAVDLDNRRAGFSSYGPTADGRIKPDLAALGSGVRVVATGSKTGFLSSSGTSFACPLVAGAAALLLSAYPELTPFQITQALRKTASQADRPDNRLGWGIVDAEAAYVYCAEQFYGQETSGMFLLARNYPNPFNHFTVITYQVPSASEVKLELFNVRGQRVRELENRIETRFGSRVLDASGLVSGMYIYRITAKELATGRTFSAVKKLVVVK